jgi:hypothetical protein
MSQLYVSKANPVGSDANAGTSKLLPFLTLAKLSATALLVAGDFASINGGLATAPNVYNESLSVRGTGTSGNSITFDTWDAVWPVFSAAETPTMVLDSAVTGGDRYKVVGLGWTPIYAHREDGVNGLGIVRNLKNAASLVACVNLDDWWYTGADFYVVVRTGEVPQAGGVNIHIAKRNDCVNEFVAGQDYITLRHLLLRFQNDASGNTAIINCNQNSTSNTGWHLDDLIGEWGEFGCKLDGQGTNSFNEVRQLFMTNCTWRYIRQTGANLIFLSAGSVVDGCTFYACGRAGLGFAARNSTIRWTRFEACADKLRKWTSPATVQGFDHGLYMVGQVPNFDRASGNLVVDCFGANCGKANFAIDALSSNHTFLRCTSVDATLYGFMFEGGTSNSSSGTKIYHCIAWRNTKSGLHVVNCHGWFDARCNQFYFNGRDGSQDTYIEWNIGSWILHSGTAGVDAVWRHDHLDYDISNVGDPTHAVLTQVASIAAVQSTTASWFKTGAAGTEGSIYVRIVGNGGTTGMTCWCTPIMSLVQMNGNNYTPVAERPVGHNIIRYTDHAATTNGTQTIAALQALLPGKEANGRQVNPAYRDATHWDFTLTAGSDSIDTGVVIPGINDGAGGSRPYRGAAPDIGANEFGYSPAYVTGDRVNETTTSVGLTDIALAGAVTTYRAFSSIAVDGDLIPYAIQHQTMPQWEVGLGRWNYGGTLSRLRVLSSSNAGLLVPFGAGTKNVFCTVPAGYGLAQAPVPRLQATDVLVPPGATSYIAQSHEIALGKTHEIGLDAVAEIG